MDVTVSVVASRNLSASALVARSLYSILQVGGATFQGSPIEVQDALFMGANAASDLVITLKNSQIQTVMYVRHVPLRLFLGEASQRALSFWLELYPPGDPRNSSTAGAFDDSPPRADAPQLHLCMRCSGSGGGPPPVPLLDSSRGSWCAGAMGPGTGLAAAPRSSWPPDASSAPAQPPPPPPQELRRTLEQMQDIKSKVSAMTDGKRQVESAEYQLQVVQKELEDARCGIEEAELQLYQLKSARTAAEEERRQAQEACSRARETLRQHEQSILELRQSCEDSERRLAQVFIDCSQQQASLDHSISNFDREMKAMAEELQHWQAQAKSLSGSLEACEKQARELQGDDLDCTKACLQDEDMRQLSSQLDRTTAELQLARSGVEEQASRLDEAERECQSAVARLADAEAAAADAREDSRLKSSELRAQADAAERELIACMSRVAALEGQVGENRNQLREMTTHVDELVGRVHRSSDTLRDTGVAVLGLKRNFQTHELDVTRQAVDADLSDLNSQLAALRERQAELHREAAKAEEEAEAFESEERQVSLCAEAEIQKAESETDRREHKRLRLVQELSAKEEELVEARQRFCEVDQLAATTQAATATAQAEAEQRVLGLEESVEGLESELEEGRRAARELDSSKRISALQLDETASILPLRKAEAQRLRTSKTSAAQERERLRTTLAEVREQLTEQDGQEEVLERLTEQQQTHLGQVREEARTVQEREAELQASLDATVTTRQEHGRAQSSLAEVESQRQTAARRLNGARLRRSQLSAEVEQLETVCRQAQERLDEARSTGALAESSHQEQLRTLEEDCQRHRAEREQWSELGEELEGRHQRLELELEQDLSEERSLASTLSTRVAEVVSVNQEIRLCDEELEARAQSMPGKLEALLELREQTMVLEGRTQTLQSELSSAEAEETRAAGLRAECDAVAAAVEQTRALDNELRGLQRESSGNLAEKNAELDRQIERLDELESDILSLTGRVEERVVVNNKLEEQLTTMDKELLEAMERSADQRARHGILSADVQRLREQIRRGHGQGALGSASAEAAAAGEAVAPAPVAPAPGLEELAADERKVDLLQEQLRGRTEAIAKAKTERQELRLLVAALETELRQLQDQQGALADKLLYQVELGGLQSTTIERVQEEVQTLEGEAEVLTLGLHDAEQRNEFLQKENQLMRQQLEGIYDGSLHDWAAEVNRLKGDVEAQRDKDELNHWMQVAQEAERELKAEVEGLMKRHQLAENALHETVKGLEAQLAQLQEKLRLAGVPKDPRSGGAVHSVPAALHGFVQPVRPSPPQVRRRALIIACNYAKSHVPLRGCANDAWNLQCLLRHSLRYADDQVRTLIDGSDSCPVPERRQPTRANILAGLKWITSDLGANDNVFIYFAGYGTQQPRAGPGPPGSCEAHYVPQDFAEDLPKDFFHSHSHGARGRPVEQAQSLGAGGEQYRLVPWAEVTRALHSLPAGCKATLLLDCCFALMPGVDAQRPLPLAFQRLSLDAARAEEARQELSCSQGRLLELPPLPTPPSPALPARLACRCHCYSPCQSEQWCVELLIEGCVQGAFTWAFVKALTAGHLDTNVQRHCKALDRIIADLQMKFGWLDQTPVLQLSATAKPEDLVLVPDLPVTARAH